LWIGWRKGKFSVTSVWMHLSEKSSQKSMKFSGNLLWGKWSYERILQDLWNLEWSLGVRENNFLIRNSVSSWNSVKISNLVNFDSVNAKILSRGWLWVSRRWLWKDKEPQSLTKQETL
jgi:hypothetical protein